MDTLDVSCVDYEFSYTDKLRRSATHRVRLFALPSWTTILITDLTDRYCCPSVTNSIEDLMNALLIAHPDIPRERMVVIEHYDDRAHCPRHALGRVDTSTRESFDLVSFLTRGDGLLYEPTWTRITRVRAEEWTGSHLL